MKMYRKEECDHDCFYYYAYVNSRDEYERLIILAARDIARFTKEIVALRYLLLDKYPELKEDMYKGLENHIDFNNLYLDIVNRHGHDPLNCKGYRNQLYRLKTTGKSYQSRFPFSIKE